MREVRASSSAVPTREGEPRVVESAASLLASFLACCFCWSACAPSCRSVPLGDSLLDAAEPSDEQLLADGRALRRQLLSFGAVALSAFGGGNGQRTLVEAGRLSGEGSVFPRGDLPKGGVLGDSDPMCGAALAVAGAEVEGEGS